MYESGNKPGSGLSESAELELGFVTFPATMKNVVSNNTRVVMKNKPYLQALVDNLYSIPLFETFDGMD